MAIWLVVTIRGVGQTRGTKPGWIQPVAFQVRAGECRALLCGCKPSGDKDLREIGFGRVAVQKPESYAGIIPTRRPGSQKN